MRIQKLSLDTCSNPTDYFISPLSNSLESVFFLQIGANDGVTNDPIYKYVVKHHWTGILIEPVPHIFEKLKKNYSEEKQLIFENVAISSANKLCSFWYVAPNNILGDKYDHIGSLFKEHVINHETRFPGISQFIRHKSVQCSTVKQILDKHSFSTIDILVVDAEGMDGEIILNFEISRFLPKIIIYEHIHLSHSIRTSCTDFLKSKYYRLLEYEKNTIAISSVHPLYGSLRI